MMREMETWLSDSRVGNNVTIVWLSTEADDQVLSPLCNSVDLHNDFTVILLAFSALTLLVGHLACKKN